MIKETHTYKDIHDGILDYARVTVILMDSDPNNSPPVNTTVLMNGRRVEVEKVAELIEAANIGVSDAAKDNKYTRSHINVDVIEGTIVDTTPKAIRTAAYNAVISALKKI
jgi:hypothetical protein